MNLPIWTVAKQISLQGRGLHSGQLVELRIFPRRDVPGFQFLRTDLPAGAPPVEVTDIDENAPPMRTVLKRGPTEVHTVEHLLSALVGMGIGAARIEVSGVEIPGLDGSARDFVAAIAAAGTAETGLTQAVFHIREPIEVSRGSARVRVLPFAGFKISYSLYYEGHPLAQGSREIDFGAGFHPGAQPEGRTAYQRDIAPARTFCMKTEAEMLRKAGFGKGANAENTLIVEGDHVEGTTLRFPDEPVRHKILDMIGDFATAGRAIAGQIVGERSGHALNRLAAQRIREAAEKE
ncbi:MAG: UDP-3-O-acyl-N-acetylglucosamine deacetylase [Planctomycetota bacterium]